MFGYTMKKLYGKYLGGDLASIISIAGFYSFIAITIFPIFWAGALPTWIYIIYTKVQGGAK